MFRHYRWPSHRTNASQFVLEPLEPRRFLDAAVLQEIPADYYARNAIPVIDALAVDAQPAQPTPFPDSGVAIGRTDRPDGVNAFTFHTKPGYIYSFRFAEDSPVQPFLSIRDQAGKFMVSETNIRCAGDSCSREFPFVTWSPPVEGTYTLEIWRDSLGDELTSGEYKIVMDAIPRTNLPDPSAPMITPGQLALQSSPVATPQVFQFHALRNAAYTFTPAESFSPTPIIQVLSADGTVLAQNNTPRSLSASWLSTTDAIVYLRIITNPDSPVTVEMSQRIDDQDGRPVDVTLPAAIGGSIDFNVRHGPIDEDFFAFHAVAGTIYVLMRSDNSSADTMLLDANYAPVSDSFEFLYRSARWTAPATGTYYLKVYGFQYSHSAFTGSYSFSLFEAPLEEQSQKPQPLPVGSTVTGQFYYPDDDRTFTLDIPARNRYRFVLSVPSWGWLSLTNVETGDEYDADAAEDGGISRPVTLEAGRYEVYIQGPSAGGFIMLADLAMNFNTDPAKTDQNQMDEKTDDSGDGSGDSTTFYANDLYVDDSDSGDSNDSSPDDAASWLDNSQDPIDPADQVVW